jgi:hypothetical protein
MNSSVLRIVLVHGLGADPKYAWMHPVAKTCLPDLLGKTFPQAQILSFAHKSHWMTGAHEITFQQFGNELLKGLMKYQTSAVRKLWVLFPKKDSYVQ